MFENYLEQLWNELQKMKPSEVVAAYDEYLDDTSCRYDRFCESELDCARMNVEAQERQLESGAQQYDPKREEQEFLDRIHEIQLKPDDHDKIVQVVRSRNQINIDHLIDVIDQVVELNGSLSIKDSEQKSELIKV